MSDANACQTPGSWWKKKNTTWNAVSNQDEKKGSWVVLLFTTILFYQKQPPARVRPASPTGWVSVSAGPQVSFLLSYLAEFVILQQCNSPLEGETESLERGARHQTLMDPPLESKIFPIELPSEHPKEGAWQVEGHLVSWKDHRAGSLAEFWEPCPHSLTCLGGSSQRMCPSLSLRMGLFYSPGQKAPYPAPKGAPLEPPMLCPP